MIASTALVVYLAAFAVPNAHAQSAGSEFVSIHHYYSNPLQYACNVLMLAQHALDAFWHQNGIGMMCCSVARSSNGPDAVAMAIVSTQRPPVRAVALAE